MTWMRRFNEFDPSDTSVPQFLGVPVWVCWRRRGAPRQCSRHDLVAYSIRYRPAEQTYALEKGGAAYMMLQAADILADELHKPHRDLLAGKTSIKKFRWGLEQLCQIPGVRGYYSSRNFKELNSKLEELTDHIAA